MMPAPPVASRAPAPSPTSAPDGGAGADLFIAGYAALFDIPDGIRDTIRRGAFARSLAAHAAPWPLCWQHQPGAAHRLGRAGRRGPPRPAHRRARSTGRRAARQRCCGRAR